MHNPFMLTYFNTYLMVPLGNQARQRFDCKYPAKNVRYGAHTVRHGVGNESHCLESGGSSNKTGVSPSFHTVILRYAGSSGPLAGKTRSRVSNFC